MVWSISFSPQTCTARIQVRVLFCAMKLWFPYYTVVPLLTSSSCTFKGYVCMRIMMYRVTVRGMQIIENWPPQTQKHLTATVKLDFRVQTTSLQICHLHFVCTHSNQEMTSEDREGTHTESVSHSVRELWFWKLNILLPSCTPMRWETPVSASKWTCFLQVAAEQGTLSFLSL